MSGKLSVKNTHNTSFALIVTEICYKYHLPLEHSGMHNRTLTTRKVTRKTNISERCDIPSLNAVSSMSHMFIMSHTSSQRTDCAPTESVHFRQLPTMCDLIIKGQRCGTRPLFAFFGAQNYYYFYSEKNMDLFRIMFWTVALFWGPF